MTGSLRTLHVNTERTWRGGERQAFFLATGLAQRGHVAEVAAYPGGEFARRCAESGLTVHEVPGRGEVNPRAIGRLARVLRQGRYQIVHAHTSHAHSLASLAAAISRTGVKVVVSRRVDFSIHRSPLRLNLIKYRLGVDRYVAISHAVKDVLVNDGVPADWIDVVPSGIDLERLEGACPDEVRRELGVVSDAPVVGAACHFAWHKGLRHLVDAMAIVSRELPDARLVLVGEGEEEEMLRERAGEKLPPDVALFPGFRRDIASCLAMFDVAVAPSEMEGLNTTNLDALALARPLVASDVGGIPEAVHHEETGLLVPPKDSEALAAAILRLLQDRDLARRLGERGRDLVRERFTRDSMVEGTLVVYRRLLGEK